MTEDLAAYQPVRNPHETIAPRLVDRLCDDMWEGLFDMPHSLNPRPWAIQVIAGVLSALDRAGYEVVRRGD